MPLTTVDQRAALVLIDLQNGIVGMPLAYPAADVVANGAKLAAAFRAQGRPVILVRVDFSSDFADAPATRVDEPRQGRRPTEGWADIVPELDRQPTDLVVTKRQWGAFYGTDLDLQLRRRGITQIVLGGIATGFGVESTARSAHEHGYHVVCVSDAMSDPNVDTHDRALTRIFPRLGEVDTTDAVLAKLAA